MGSVDMKIGRNDKCSCGSGRKYKNCCLKKNTEVEKELNNMGELVFSFDEEKIEKGIKRLNELLAVSHISKEQKRGIYIYLLQAYKNHGEHNNVISTFEKLRQYLDFENETELELILFCYIIYAASLNELGLVEDAKEILDDILTIVEEKNVSDITYAGVALELSKAVMRLDQGTEKALEILNKALKKIPKNDKNIGQIARIKSNKAFILLNSKEKEEKEQGVKLLDDCLKVKIQEGDVEGICNIYCQLGMYYWREKKYDSAIAYTRKDLALSRKAGDKRAIVSSLNNLAAIYTDLNQFSKARGVLIEAKKISETLGDMQAIVIASKNLEVVNHKAKIAGMNGEKMGPAALCKCGKGLSYKECCGKADFEPEELGFKIDNISEDIEVIQQQVAKRGRVASHIDYLLRKIKENDVRLAWTNIEIHNGWIEMKELVDMANLYLVSAEKLAKEAKEVGNYAEKPLACIMLSCCALEAFINQAIYFISVSEIVIPEKHQGIKDDSFGFQRNTELTLKWNIIGEILCESEWKPCAKLWNNFINLIFIRNELVHFKVSEFEQVVPRPEQAAEALKRIPKDVELNDIPHSWPLRILNPSFAEWCVKTAKEMINYIKEAYQKNLSKVEYKVNDKR